MDMQNNPNFSLVLATYEDPIPLPECIESVFRLDYPKDSFELILINDGSKDNTWEIIKEHESKAKELGIRYQKINFKENQGRIVARLAGAEAANFKNIMILDTRAIINKDALKKASKYIPEYNVISNYYMDKKKSFDDRFFFLVRKKYYKPYWGLEFENVEIKKDNFNKISKGTGGFITSKDSFIKYSKQLEGAKSENEDTKLFKIYIDYGEKFIRVSDVKLLYKNRGGWHSIKHIFGRGPRFVDFYVKNNTKFKLLLLLSVIAILLIIILSIANLRFLLAVLVLLILIDIITSVYLSEDTIDFIVVLLYLPIILGTFYLGVLNGLRIHSTK